MITIDTLRADALGFAGRGGEVSPFLDALASEGVVFTRAMAPSSFTPVSMASLMTGLWPRSHGVTWGRLDDREAAAVQPELPGALPVLAEAFQSGGYTTVGVPSNRHLMASLGFGRGFDRYWGEAPFTAAEEVDVQAFTLLAEALGPDFRRAWRRGPSARPLFLWLHYVDPHAPYEPWRPWLGAVAPARLAPQDLDAHAAALRDLGGGWEPRRASALDLLYQGEVRRVDDALARLWEVMAFDEDVLVVVTSDHGEELGERGATGHATTLYREVVEVPLMVRWPRGFPGGRRIDRPVSLVDIAPTLTELASLADLGELPGRSLVPLLRDPDPLAPWPDRLLFAELHEPRPELELIRDGDLSMLIHAGDPDSAELYDLALDPWERLNLAPSHPQEVRRLYGLTAAWREALPTPPPSDLEVERDPQVIEELRTMGYAE